MSDTNNQNPIEPVNNFVALSKINVNGHTEKKGKYTYLSWAFAVAEAMEADPQASWNFRDPLVFADGTMMVQCDVVMFGKSIYMFLPVMNNVNKAIENPNAFDVNSAMMRCLVKGIAAHGLGLYIYAGEDLPEEEKQAQQNQNNQQQAQNQGNQQSNHQQKPKRSEAQLFSDALMKIKDTTDKNVLTKAALRFKGTNYEPGITNACRARADQMGWPTQSRTQQNNQSNQSNQMHH